MNVLGAIIAGVVGTIVMTMVMVMAPKMGMPKMDIVGMLGSMFNAESNRKMGMAMHFMMGVVFAIVYAILWNAGFGVVGLLWGVIFWGAPLARFRYDDGRYVHDARWG